MLLSEKIQYEINLIDEIVDEIYACDKGWYEKLNANIADILNLVNQLINIIPALEQMGIELPKDILDSQVSSVSEAIKNKDFMVLADVLKYGIKDSLYAFEELVVGGVVNDEELL